MAKKKVDDFHRHELMDRADFAGQVLDLLEQHPAHTRATRKAFEAAQLAVSEFYQAAAAERFKGQS